MNSATAPAHWRAWLLVFATLWAVLATSAAVAPPSPSDNHAIHLAYDADGVRIGKTILDGTGALQTSTTYLVCTNNLTGYAQVLEEAITSATTNILRTYTYGHDLLSVATSDSGTGVPPAGSSSTLRYYAYDGGGSIRALTDETGTVTDRYTYDAYGVLMEHWSASSSTSDLNSYLYRGEQWDADLGLYYLRARFLNPNSGRFWTEDTYEGSNADPASLHKYLYANGNPITFSDPSGFLSLLEYALIGQAVHRFIGVHFIQQSPASRVADITLGQILEDFVEDEMDIAIRPDLVDKGTMEAYEIKPNRSGKGAQKAKKQLQRYIDAFSVYGVGLRPGTSYEPPSVIPPPPPYFKIRITAERTDAGVILYKIEEAGDPEKLNEVAAAATAAYTMAHLSRLVSAAIAAQSAGIKRQIGTSIALRGLY